MKEFEYKNIKVLFKSIGGIESCFILPQYQIAFDMGRCPAPLIDIPQIFLSHGHLDHASGVSYYFSQRSLKNLGHGTIYVPGKILRPIKKIAELWQGIEEFKYKSSFVGLKPGSRVEVRKNLFIMAVEAKHRISALGYVLIRVVKKLKKEYLHLSGRQIEKLKQTEDIFEVTEQPIFAYSGDSSIEIIEQNEVMRKAKVLFMECTYIDEKRDIARARAWGHTHLDEIREKSHLFENEKVVLVHLSRRYDSGYIQSVLAKKFPTRAEREKFVYPG